MTWQVIAVIAIEGLAVAYLVYRLLPPAEKPHVKTSDLTRKKKRQAP